MLPSLGRAVVFLLALRLLTAAPDVAAADPSSADAAFDAGDGAKALALYNEELSSNPGNVHALVRSGMLLSWQGKYDEAVKRYDLALRAEPADRTATLERAKALSWDRKHVEAAQGFRRLLEPEPSDREARLGLARSLSWGGDQKAGRAEYEKVLAQHRSDPEALVGVAQTYAWSGHGVEARELYDRALRSSPGMKEALLGLAYLDLEEGDIRAGRSKATDLERRFPADSEVVELDKAVRREQAPWIRTSYDRLDDTDDNAIDITRAEGGMGLPAGTDLLLGIARYDMGSPAPTAGSPDVSASIDSLYGVLGYRATSHQRVELRLGTDRLENTTGVRENETIGGATYLWRLGDRWEGRVAAERDTYRYSPLIVDNAIVVDAYSASVSGRLGERFRVEGNAGVWDLSDGNRRRNAGAAGWYTWPGLPLTLETGYAFVYSDFRDDTSGGYFDPSNFRAHLLRGAARGKFGKTSAYYEATLEAGLQSFRRDGVKVSNDDVLGFTGLAGYPVARGFNLELLASRNDYAVQSAGGFRVRQIGVRLRYQFGG